MSRVTDVGVFIDTETILKDCKNPSKDFNKPTFIDPKYVYMVVNQDNVINGQAGGELNLKASVGDVVRWRENSLSFGFESSCMFYKFEQTGGGGDLISPPNCKKAEVTICVPNAQDPREPQKQTVNNWWWSCETLKAGTVTYHFWFQIRDRQGNLSGCFHWDPYITIRN